MVLLRYRNIIEMKYKIFYEYNGVLKNKILKANSLDELKLHNDLPKNIIKIKKIKNIKLEFNFIRKNDQELLELFYEMSVMLEANLPIKDVVEILLNTQFSSTVKKILLSIQNSLLNGQPIYKSLKTYQNYLGYLPILFFRLGERNGNIAYSISSLYQILNESFIIKQKLKKAISYPSILVAALFIAVGIIFNFVIPRFDYIFSQLGDNLPFSTYCLVWIKNFIDNYYIYILLVFLMLMSLLIVLYKFYKYKIDQILLLNIPYFSNMYRYMILYKLFLSLSFIVKSKFQFQDALQSSKNISNNLYVKNNFENIIQDINNGYSISRAFEKTNLFDTVTIRLLLTAQKTNKMEIILEDIQKIYQKKLSQNIKLFTTFLEPFLILIISSIVLWLVLAIMTPVWQLSSLI